MRCIRCTALLVLALATMGASAQAAVPVPVPVYAAGGLREVLTELARLWQARGGAPVVLTFGASSLLRERIEQGDPAQVFASADVEHPQRLARTGHWQAPVVFARNAVCALTAPEVEVTPQTLLDALLRRDIRLGTSTPGADLSGDYARALFRRADAIHPGAYDELDAKALRLTVGPNTPKAPPGFNTYAWVMAQGQADVFLTYCTNAVASQHEVPRLKVVHAPPELQVGPAYGLTVRSDAPAAAQEFASFVTSAPAQAVFGRLGFDAP